MLWIDHASVLQHGHLLGLVKTIYSKRIFYTNEEMFERTGERIDVQAIVEFPETYVLAKCRDTIDDKLTFVDSRREDIEDLADDIKLTDTDDRMVHDRLRYFSADEPERQFEAGQSIGGSYPCTGCSVQAASFADLARTFRSEPKNLEERRKIVSIISIDIVTTKL